jgi:8-oxo-dGTP pyrophosphatase MutT (NUDIX family)
MLDLDPAREGPPPRDAATLVLVRDGDGGLEVFCVERNKGSGFLGGAIVFPGGRVEDADREDAWAPLVNDPAAELRTFAVAACRETLEEAALLLADVEVADADVVALRERLAADSGALRAFLTERGAKLDLGALVPLAHWITPKVESRRFDARFFVARAPAGQSGAHDMTETMASFWEGPRAVLERFDRGEIQLAPPTHRTLEILAKYTDAAAVLAHARAARIAPICPELVQQGDTVALVLPGDPEHSVREARIEGASRYVLRDRHFRPENAPPGE